jgi:hypothetical protein
VAQRRRHAPARSDLALTPATLNRLLELPLRLESRLLASGRRLAFGLSLLAILRRVDRSGDAHVRRRDGGGLDRTAAIP